MTQQEWELVRNEFRRSIKIADEWAEEYQQRGDTVAARLLRGRAGGFRDALAIVAWAFRGAP